MWPFKSKAKQSTQEQPKQKRVLYTLERFILNKVRIEFHDSTRRTEVIEQYKISKFSDDKVIQISFRVNTPEVHHMTLTFFKADIARLEESYRVETYETPNYPNGPFISSRPGEI